MHNLKKYVGQDLKIALRCPLKVRKEGVYLDIGCECRTTPRNSGKVSTPNNIAPEGVNECSLAELYLLSGDTEHEMKAQIPITN
jgi:hypothetical protein